MGSEERDPSVAALFAACRLRVRDEEAAHLARLHARFRATWEALDRVDLGETEPATVFVVRPALEATDERA